MDRSKLFLAVFGIIATSATHPAFADDAAQPVYTYNGQGQVTLLTYPNGAALSYVYDANGNLTSVVQVSSPTPPPSDDSGSATTN